MSLPCIVTPTKGILIIKPASRAIADTVLKAEVVAISNEGSFYKVNDIVIYQGNVARKLFGDLFYIEEDQIIAFYLMNRDPENASEPINSQDT